VYSTIPWPLEFKGTLFFAMRAGMCMTWLLGRNRVEQGAGPGGGFQIGTANALAINKKLEI
jgi:hypothetical protein